MRIALVCPYDWSRHGGVRAHVAALAAHLAGRHEVRILAPASEPETADSMLVPVGRPTPVPFNRSVAPVALSPLVAGRTRRALAALAPDVVHVHEPLAPVTSVAAALAGGRRGAPPTIGTFHTWSDRDRAYRLVAPLGRRVVGGLATCTAVSTVARDYAATALGVPANRLPVVPNAVEARRYAEAEPIPELVDPDRPLLLFVGRLEPRKGCDLAVRAFLRLRRAHPQLRLCVVGDGPRRRDCEDLVPADARANVWFAGAVDEEDKRRFYASADLFLAPNLGGESFGIVLLEAMAAGLPIVGSAIPGFRTVMTDGCQGRLVPPGDVAAFSAAVEGLLDDPVRTAGMSAEGRRTAAAHDWPVVGARVERLYEAVVSPSGQR